MDWDKWFDLFQVALMAKFSISVSELTRETTQQNPKVRPLLGEGLQYSTLVTGRSSKKNFMDKYAHTALWYLKAQELMYRVLSKKEKQNTRYAAEKTNPGECYRCGAAKFTMEHVNFCMAINHRCKYF